MRVDTVDGTRGFVTDWLQENLGRLVFGRISDRIIERETSLVWEKFWQPNSHDDYSEYGKLDTSYTIKIERRW